MINIVKQAKDLKLSGYDYILDSINKYKRIEQAIKLPKLDSTEWKVALVEIAIKDIREELDKPDNPNAIVDIYCPRDVFLKITAERPVLLKPAKSAFEGFEAIVLSSKYELEPGVISMLYKRIGFDTFALDEFYKEFEEAYKGERTITRKVVSTLLLDKESTYPSDVVEAVLLQGRDPRRGFNRNPIELYESLQRKIGEDAAFYSVRKHINKLYEIKMKTLRDKRVDKKYTALFEVVDIVELQYLVNLFGDAAPKMGHALLFQTQRRRQLIC